MRGGIDSEAMASELSALASASAKLGERLAGLRSREEMRKLRMDQLAVMVGEAKSRMARQPKMQEFLERLQDRCHQKSVGLYEELLTAVVHDVLGGVNTVALSLKTLRGLPALDIEMATPEGKRESIMEGNGGALTNIVSTGLRVIALARSGAYPFLVLDEPDCWIKPEMVPQFATVVGQIAKDLGIQVLLISHHDAGAFAGFSSQVKLGRRGGKLEARPEGNFDASAWIGAKTGVKQFRLRDFMSHEDTVIPLSPGVTCLIGDNNIGKSAVVSALRALFHGSGEDTAIAHGASHFNVEAVFHDDSRLSVERYAKKSPKQRWRYWIPGQTEPLHDASPKDGAPEWVDMIAKVARDGDLDIAFAKQKTPVFLLDQPPSARARILAVGRESAHLQRLIAKNKDRNLIDARLARDGEQEGAAINRELETLSGLGPMEDELLRAKSRGGRVEAAISAAESVAARVARLEALARVIDDGSLLSSWGAPAAPRLEAVDELARSLAALRRAAGVAVLDAPEPSGAAPVAISTEGLAAAMRALTRARAAAALPDPSAPARAPVLQGVEALRRALPALGRSRAAAAQEPPPAPPAAPALFEVDRLLDFGRRLSRLVKLLPAMEAAAKLAPPSRPALSDTDRLAASMALLSSRMAGLEKAPGALAKIKEQTSRLFAEREALIEEMGGACPTCGEAISAHGGERHVEGVHA